ncbi:hypothetical protein CW676_10475 [Macrococcoides caseolyticum]|uniref:hypothetical protein n=1 Tax=Macrococcoides caseolyticum TaxID=69966 RepID=UPI000C34E804|nr:hypothetical protein [Macrococcus caseolyticus]PKE05984.1 hypothetical protein CW692_10805 [Macrococcus caseolyticus]PKE23192.1 hypothetical protein CW689_10455 [Macrococcus caseolyticus]PKE52281.1 hypothetical protein CW676_10475 [Macrococcus caseolyticus]PKF37786.1 hypothetical protein CW681_10325 [Macrococcus caseolyticus]
MNKAIAIKELFSIQNVDEKILIIKNFNLTITGFSKINKENINNLSKLIDKEIVKPSNLNKINNKIKNIKQNKDIGMDYLLNTEKILEKYKYDFESLILIFEKDKYQEKTQELVLKLQEMNDIPEESTEINRGKEVDSIKELRTIIINKEEKIHNQEKKIEKMSDTIKSLRKENNDLAKQYKDKSKEIIEYKKNMINLENELVEKEIMLNKEKSINMEIVKLKNVLSSKDTELQKLTILYKELKQKYNEKLNSYYIIGVNELFKKQYSGSNLHYFSYSEIEYYIEAIKNKGQNDLFLAYELGIPMNINRKIKKISIIKTFDDIKEIEKVVKGNIDG